MTGSQRRQPKRDLAGIPKGSLIVARAPHGGNHTLAIVVAGIIWWNGQRFDSASPACRAMRGDDRKQVNGWDELGVLTDEGFVPLKDAYDEKLFGDPPAWTREQLRTFLGDVKPEAVGLVPRD